MVVSEKNVSDALTYLADDPHPLAIAKKRVTDAENKAKRIWARAVLSATGSDQTKKATAEIDPKYADAKDEESEAIQELERCKARAKAAEMIISVWQSEGANARAAERVR